MLYWRSHRLCGKMENAGWRKKCLAATLMILLNGIVLTNGSPVREVGHKTGKMVSHEAKRHGPEKSDYYLYVTGESGKANKRFKNWQPLIWELEPVVLKLRNVIDKYNVKEEELKVLYPWVNGCGKDSCGKFRDFLPKNHKLERLSCKKFKKPKRLKKRTLKLLSFFHKGVQNLDKGFQMLIDFEKSSEFKKRHLSNESRLRILNELHTEVKTLHIEIIETINILTNKRLNPQPSNMTMEDPISQTELMINEWRIIQQSKEFLQKWRKQIERLFKCWKKIGRRGFFQGH